MPKAYKDVRSRNCKQASLCWVLHPAVHSFHLNFEKRADSQLVNFETVVEVMATRVDSFVS